MLELFLEKFLINPFVVPADNQNIENQPPRLKAIIHLDFMDFFHSMERTHNLSHKLENEDYEDHFKV